MSAEQPNIAAVIPAHQAERFVGEAIESVLAQVRSVAEIVVVDDGSTDGTADVVRQFGSRVRLLQQPQAGAGAARSAGVAATDSPLLAFLDADDRWTPNATHLLGAALAQRADALFAFGAATVFHDATWISETRLGVVAAGPVMLASTSLIRRAAFDVVGPFEAGNTSMVEWFARAIETGKGMLPVDDVVAERRIHGANTSARDVDVRTEFARIIKASLDRRRTPGGGLR